MNINNVSNINFNAHFKDNFEYSQFKKHLTEDHFMPYGVFREVEGDLMMLPDAEIALDYFDCDEHRAYLHGTINQDGEIKELDMAHPHCETLLYDIYDRIASILTNKS